MKITDRCSEYISGMVMGTGALAAVSVSAQAATAITLGLPALIGAGTLIGFWVTGKFRHSVESKRALRKVRRSIQRDWRKDPEFSSLEQAEMEAAAKALEDCLPRAMLSQEELARAAIDRERRPFPQAATEIVLDALEDEDSRFEDGEIPRLFARQVITAAFTQAVQDDQYFKGFERYLLVELAGYIGKSANDVELLRAEFDEYKKLQAERHAELIANFAKVKAQLDDRGETLPQTIVDQLAEIRNEDETLEQQIQSLIAQYQAAQSAAAEGLQPHNTDAFVDHVLRRVSEMLQAGDAEAADDEIQGAFKQWQQQENERQAAERRNGARLLETAIKTGYALGRFEAVAEAEWELIKLTVPEANWTNALWNKQTEYMEQGERMGVQLDLDISLALCDIGLSTAPTPQDEAGHRNNKSLTLRVLGVRTGGEVGLTYLREALRGYDAALEVRTRESAAAQWAMTLLNRAGVLQVLGVRTGGKAGSAYLRDALSGCDGALEVYTKETAARDWALTQQNRAIVLRLLGERTEGEAGLGYLREALSGYDAALEVRTRESTASGWAMTQQNRANVLLVLGQRTRGEASLTSLRKALSGYDAALEVYTRESAAADWAMTQQNRAIALETLGQRTGGKAGLAYLREALSGYAAALEVFTIESAPAQWAMTKENVAFVYVTRFEIAGDASDLVLAEEAATEAMSVYGQGCMSYNVERCQHLLDRIAKLKAKLG